MFSGLLLLCSTSWALPIANWALRYPFLTSSSLFLNISLQWPPPSWEGAWIPASGLLRGRERARGLGWAEGGAQSCVLQFAVYGKKGKLQVGEWFTTVITVLHAWPTGSQNVQCSICFQQNETHKENCGHGAVRSAVHCVANSSFYVGLSLTS